jgi:hypothetical protein
MATLLHRSKKSRSWLSLVGIKLTREMKNLPQPLKLLEEAT